MIVQNYCDNDKMQDILYHCLEACIILSTANDFDTDSSRCMLHGSTKWKQ